MVSSSCAVCSQDSWDLPSYWPTVHIPMILKRVERIFLHYNPPTHVLSVSS